MISLIKILFLVALLPIWYPIFIIYKLTRAFISWDKLYFRILKFAARRAAWFVITFRGIRVRFAGRPANLQRAIKKAKKLHTKTGRRYRVFFIARRYRVYHRDDIKANKKAGIFRWWINSTTINKISFFDTNDLQPCTSQKKS